MYLDDDLSQNPWLQAVNQQLKHYLADEFISADIVIKIVSEDWERRQYYRLREATFRDEQQILKEDRDEYDFKAFGIVAIGQMFGEPDRVIGAVRIFPEGKKDLVGWPALCRSLISPPPSHWESPNQCGCFYCKKSGMPTFSCDCTATE